MKFLILMLLVISPVLSAEELSSISEAQKLAESVMVNVGSNKMREGINKLRPYSLIPEAEFDVQLSNLNMQLPAMTQRFGTAIGYDFIGQEKVGDSLVQLIYIQKFEKHAMVWRFVFYKPKDKWLLNIWYFNDQVQQLFKK